MTNREALIEARLAYKEATNDLQRAKDAYLRERGWHRCIDGSGHWYNENGSEPHGTALRLAVKADPGGRF
jgi:hypothetical protein